MNRTLRIDNIKLKILPGVFPPQYVFSSKLLVGFIGNLKLNGKTFLDLGSGSGILAIRAAMSGAIVTAVDINKYAIINTKLNAEKNEVSLYALQSDLFDGLKNQRFDVVVINPPYYPSKAKNESEMAWYCGENFEYFDKLFYQLKERMQELGEIYMILSEDCDIKKITKMAESCNLEMLPIREVRKWWETNYIFSLTQRKHVD